MASHRDDLSDVLLRPRCKGRCSCATRSQYSVGLPLPNEPPAEALQTQVAVAGTARARTSPPPGVMRRQNGATPVHAGLRDAAGGRNDPLLQLPSPIQTRSLACLL